MSKKYIGNVELHYKSSNGIPLTRNVFAFHDTAKELKECFLPLANKKEVKLVKSKNCKVY